VKWGLGSPYNTAKKDERVAGGGSTPVASGLCHQYVSVRAPNNKVSVTDGDEGVPGKLP